ncbi:MAG: tetratricopeptide repeat protein [Spirochaetaceae bacterium]|jgi:tetratricopeptide (TPR) repeat protein|nr:tetratricopeptide repeat protein [Spirochaetaceae bacterium]
MAAINEKKEVLTLSESLAFFIQKNRKAIFVFAGAVIIITIGFIAALGIQDYIRTRAVSGVEALNDRYEALRFSINESEKEAEVTALLEELSAFAAKTASFPGARAYAMIASIHGDKKNWAEAESNWILAAGKGKKTYLAPVAFFNAAAAAEEQGNIEGAVTHYNESLNYAADFPQAPRAQFAIGRLREEQQNRDAALEAYRVVAEKWPAETVWTNLANSRIISLTGGNP